MLVLSRRLNEKLLLPDLGVTIQVVALKTGVVRLGIDAPEHVHVLRGELAERDAAGEQADEPVRVSQPAPAAAPRPLNQLVAKRLALVRQGLDVLQRSVAEDLAEETDLLLEKLDQDLRLLRERLHCEARKEPRLRSRRRPSLPAADAAAR